jgi:hypothetical protein
LAQSSPLATRDAMSPALASRASHTGEPRSGFPRQAFPDDLHSLPASDTIARSGVGDHDGRSTSGVAMISSREQDALVRRTIYETFVARGGPPTRAAVVLASGLDAESVAASYERLALRRAIVLDSVTGEVRMAMPFSAVPTAFRVRSGGVAWWANCAWDALGIAAATGRDVEIVTDCPDCHDRLVLRTVDGVPEEVPWVVHFLVPAARWWDDIGFT